MTREARAIPTVAGKRPKLWRSCLQEARHARKMTLKQAAAGIGITVPYLNNLEHGTRDPSLALAYRIAAFYRKTVVDLWLEHLPKAAS